jgi:hypothetical protein
MNTTPIKQALSVAGLLLTGAAGGILGAKYFAPQWLAPAAASASLSPAANPVSTPSMPGISFKPAPPSHSTSTTPKAAVTSNKPAPISKQDAEAQARALANMLMTCRSQLELYKLQHHDKLPEFSRHIWDQLTLATRGDGTPDPKGSCGPYLQSVPINPLNGFASLGLVRKDPAPGQVMPGSKLGFVFCPTTGHLFGTGVDGKTIFDEALPEQPVATGGAPVLHSREARVASVKNLLQTLRADLELYKLQHVDLPPDFVHNPGWEQMTRKTRSTGAFDLRGFGPYVMRRPVNAINGFYKVESAATVPTNYKAKGQQIGFVFETSTGRLFATDEDGGLLKE